MTGDQLQPTCPQCGPAAVLEGQYWRVDEGAGVHDLYSCPECGGEWTPEDLDQTSAYAQARIDGDPVAERVRRLAREQRARERARRADIRRAWRVAMRDVDSLDPTRYRPALERVAQLRKATQRRPAYEGGPWEFLRLGFSATNLNRAAQLRRERAWRGWRESHAVALGSARQWSQLRPTWRGLPE